MNPRALFLVAVLGSSAASAVSDDPTSVVILVNDLAPPEAGTGKVGSSQYVGNYYAQARKVPRENIFHFSYQMSCCSYSPAAWDSWHIKFAVFEEKIRKPLRKFLEDRKLKDRIRYIVSTYGVPTHLDDPTESLSVDQFLAALYSPRANNPASQNPYYHPDPESSPPRFRDFVRPWPQYLVTRMDGPSAMIAKGLVDKALDAERGIDRKSGIGYFDLRANGSLADATMRRADELCRKAGMRCVLNDQSVTRSMIANAPETLWAWGWYSGVRVNDVYQFQPGAVGAQLTSYTANSIRSMKTGTWVPLWLTRGITATWGATGEPTTAGYAMGDNLLNHLWAGYNFAEAAYLATPQLGWMMIFVGDPLYSPVFGPRTAPQATGCSFELQFSRRSFSSGEEQGSVEVKTEPGCAWTAEIDQWADPKEVEPKGWFQASDTTGAGDGVIRFTMRRNAGDIPRTASIRVADQVALLMQQNPDSRAPYTDVAAVHPMADAIRLIRAFGAALPCGTERFCPDDQMTRAELAALLVRGVFGLKDDFSSSAVPYFEDVPTTHPLFRWVQKLAELGITRGCSAAPARFCPADPATRAQAAVLLIRARLGDS
ncbi:MAG: TIGR03790 family protein, partial [Bryobacteraceae bacterium]